MRKIIQSLDYTSEKIYHSKTYEYFKEVLSSYQHGNYRSATVILYSVVICDLVYKLEELADKYDDDKAKGILDSIKTTQKNKPESSEWEQKLISEVKKRTNLLGAQESLNIDYLRNSRHLAAHPVLDEFDILVQPNQETVRAHIINMLTGVLCNPPLLSNNLIETFLNDLISIKKQLIYNDELKSYLENKYYNKLNTPTKEKLFRTLWKFVFRLDSTEGERNRIINFKALVLLYKNDPPLFNTFISSESEYYSNIDTENDKIFNLILHIYSSYPIMYENMNEPTKLLIDKKGKKDEWIARAVFLSDTFAEHIKLLETRMLNDDFETKSRFEKPAINLLYDISKEYAQEKLFLDLLIKLFVGSQNFNDADYHFLNYIYVYLDNFNKEQIVKIIEGINTNNQLYNRGWSKSHNKYIKDIVNEKYKSDIDLKKYDNFET